MKLARSSAVIIDVDPMLTSFDGASVAHLARLVGVLKEKRVPFRLLTNDSLHSDEELVAAFQHRAIDVDANQIQTPSRFLARWLGERTPRATVYLMGSDAARADMERCGLRVIEQPEEIGYLCDYIVTGAYPSFSYPALRNALECFQTDASVVAIDLEPVVPGSNDLPGGGPTAAALQTMLRRAPHYVAGMPNPDWLLSVAGELRVPASGCLVVGSAKRSPAQASRAAGMSAVVVGVADVETGGPGAPTSESASVVYVPDDAGLIDYLKESL